MRKPTSQQAALASAQAALGGGFICQMTCANSIKNGCGGCQAPYCSNLTGVRHIYRSGAKWKFFYLRSASTLDRIFKEIASLFTVQLPNMEEIEFDLVKNR